MKCALLAALAAFSLFPSIARADQVSADANRLALEQVIDAAQTSAFAGERWGCRVGTCGGGMTEADPLARPFARSVIVNLAAAALVNLAFRRIAERPTPTGRLVRRILRLTTFAYPLLLQRNLQLLSRGAR